MASIDDQMELSLLRARNLAQRATAFQVSQAALTTQDALISRFAVWKNLRADRIAITQATDDLLALLLATFEGEFSAEDVREVFQRRRAPWLDADDLSALVAGVVPVGIMRELIHDHRLSFCASACEHWRLFSLRYADVLALV